MYEGQFVLFFNKVCKVVMLSYDVQVCVFVCTDVFSLFFWWIQSAPDDWKCAFIFHFTLLSSLH